MTDGSRKVIAVVGDPTGTRGMARQIVVKTIMRPGAALTPKDREPYLLSPQRLRDGYSLVPMQRPVLRRIGHAKR